MLLAYLFKNLSASASVSTGKALPMKRDLLTTNSVSDAAAGVLNAFNAISSYFCGVRSEHQSALR